MHSEWEMSYNLGTTLYEFTLFTTAQSNVIHSKKSFNYYLTLYGEIHHSCNVLVWSFQIYIDHMTFLLFPELPAHNPHH